VPPRYRIFFDHYFALSAFFNQRTNYPNSKNFSHFEKIRNHNPNNKTLQINNLQKQDQFLQILAL